MHLIDKLPSHLKIFPKPIHWKYISIFCALAFLTSCASTKYRKIDRDVRKRLEGAVFQNHFTGLLVVDANSLDTIIDLNSEDYFTPASNLKILTLYTALNLIPDSIPVATYVKRNDTLWFSGTGDPTQLHPEFNDSTLVKFLGEHEVLMWYPNNFNEGRYAPGWAWEDYPYYFSPERSSLPLYGNAIKVIGSNDSATVVPAIFRDSITWAITKSRRKEFSNEFYVHPNNRDTLLIPYTGGFNTVRKLLESAGAGEVKITDQFPDLKRTTLFGRSRDSVCARMMIESDNFLAEQLMLLASSQISDTLSFTRVRDSVLANELSDLPQKPRWVDGSGLSRYNLLSPASTVAVLKKLFREIERDRLYAFFPKGGENGTLENWYGSDGRPYIIAKTGTLGNNYSVSGYLLTDKDRVLVFSFMNNHFTIPRQNLQLEMQMIFEYLKQSL